MDWILSFWGGYNTNSLLGELEDFQPQKPIVGFSDTTALLLALHKRFAKAPLYYGPAAITFAKPIRFAYTEHSLIQALTKQEGKFEPSREVSTNADWWQRTPPKMEVRPNPGWKVFRHGEATGKLLGGNLGVLLSLVGTPYLPSFEDCILFLEDDEVESPETLHRYFTQARQAGLFQNVRGVVFGRLPDAVTFSSQEHWEMILAEGFPNQNIPILYDLDFGHTDPLLTFPLGAEGKLQTDPLSFTWRKTE